MAELAPSEVEALDAYSTTVIAVAERLTASVASLRVIGSSGSGRRPVGSGSAVVISRDGYLLTSAHVVAAASGGDAVFVDGSEHPFAVVGTDPLSDLAVVRVQGSDLVAAELGDADQLRVGQLVVAVGNPMGYAGSVTTGVVSALGRSVITRAGSVSRVVEDVIQTDAALNPGNSGGALADSRSRVIGVNTAVAGIGLGLAVPINATTQRILGALIAEGRVRRAYLGIAGGTRALPQRAARFAGHAHGLEVVEVVDGSPAMHAGLRPGDIIVSVDGTPLQTAGALQRLMTAEAIGHPLAVRVLRADRAVDLTVTPVELSGVK
jgi:S1-C subfamily serine protease